jgi:hypothetical protein
MYRATMGINFKFNEAALEKLKQDAIRKLQPEVDARLQGIIRGVRDEMEGQPADDVYAELVTRLDAAGVTPNEPNVRKLAEEIQAGTLTG